MKNSTLIQPTLKLSKKNDAKLAEFTAQCINSIGENAAAFTTMNPTLVELTACYNDFVEKMENCGRNGNPSSTSAKNQSRETLCNTLTWCASSCSEIAGNDVALFELSGFSPKANPTKITSVDCPTNVKVTFGPFEGSVYCSFDNVKGARCYEICYSGTNSPDMSTWSTMMVTSSRRTMITDLPSMSKCYMRIRTIGPRGIMSAFTSTIEFKVV